MKIIWSLFPKFFRHLEPAALADIVHEAGLDTTNLIVREGYWVEPDRLQRDLPPFMRAMRQAGLDVHFATTDYSAQQIVTEPDLLTALADQGLTEFRMAHFRYDANLGARGGITEAQKQMALVAKACERAGIRAVYQVHHDTLISSASAAYALTADLSPRWVGIELDPGNQSFEGLENWEYSVSLLGDSLVAAGIKDTALIQDPSRAEGPEKGWLRKWHPLDKGVINWHLFIRALALNRFCGTFVFMPFYDENDPVAITRKLTQEVSYLRAVVEESEEKRHDYQRSV